MTVHEFELAQSLTAKPVKGMLTGGWVGTAAGCVTGPMLTGRAPLPHLAAPAASLLSCPSVQPQPCDAIQARHGASLSTCLPRTNPSPPPHKRAGPVTILQWSFPRCDVSRSEQAAQLALALRGEVEDLVAAGCRILQVCGGGDCMEGGKRCGGTWKNWRPPALQCRPRHALIFPPRAALLEGLPLKPGRLLPCPTPPAFTCTTTLPPHHLTSTPSMHMVQVDEPALREGLPLKEGRRERYLSWAVDAFRLATAAAPAEVQVRPAALAALHCDGWGSQELGVCVCWVGSGSPAGRGSAADA